MKKKQKIIIGIIVITILLIVLYSSGIFENKDTLSITSGDLQLFAKPIWGRMECGKEEVFTTITTTISKNWDDNWIDCGGSTTELAEECSIYIDGGGDNWYSTDSITVKYRICTIGGACGPQRIESFLRSSSDQKIGENLLSGQTMQLVAQSGFLGLNFNADIDKRFFRFKLFDYFAGGKRVINSVGCNIPYTDEFTGDKIQDKVLQNSYSSEGGGCISGSFKKGEWCNYVHDYVFGPGTNVFNHPIYGEVYCTGNSIYKITNMQVKSGKLIKINPTYDDSTEDNKNIKGLGDFLDYVECCPNVPKCNDNFVFEEVPGECVTDIDCPSGGGWVYFSPKKVSRYKCINKICVLQDTVPVSCADDSDCPSGYSCSKLGSISQWSCVSGGQCSKLGEGCLKTSDCCQKDNLICSQNKCSNKTGGCESCMDWVSSLFKSESNKCKSKGTEVIWYNPLTWFNVTGLLSQNLWCPILLGSVSIVFIFSTLFGLDFLNKFKAISGRNKNIVRLIIAIIISLIISYITYIAFVIGVIIFIIYLILRFSINSFLPIKFLKK